MNILIGYDGSAAADEALRDLEMAGLPADADAHILVALQPAVPSEAYAADPAGAYLPVEPSPDLVQKAKERGDHAARRLRVRFPFWRVAVETAVGVPAQAILEKADLWKADWIAVGSHGWTWLRRAFLGSTAEKLLFHAKVNVRLCHPLPEARTEAPRILAALDGSSCSRGALDAMARRAWPPEAQFRLLTAKPSDPWSDALSAASEKQPGRKAPPHAAPEMERFLDAAAARLSQAGLSVVHEILEGDPRVVILREAEAWKADCIFLGRRGLSGFDRILLGSVSSAVASHAPCSVEVVPC